MAGLPPLAALFALALVSRAPIVLSSLDGGVWVLDQKARRVAEARGRGPLALRELPKGLPDGIERVEWAAGGVDRVWLSLRMPQDAEARRRHELPRTPLVRVSPDELHEVAPDWQPLIAAWSNRRLLSMSTSSRRLKIKAIDPFQKDAPSDLPSADLADEACGSSLRLLELDALDSGEAFAAGSCRFARGARYVIVRWPSASAPVLDAPLDEARALRHLGLVALARDEVYTMAADAERARVWRFDGTGWNELALPPLAGAPLGLAATSAGELWLGSERSLWRLPRGGDWTSVDLPVAKDPWRLAQLAASGDEVWLRVRSSSRHAVLRLEPVAAPLRWE